MAIVGVVTDLAREKWAKYLGNIDPFKIAAGFKVGEGGWIDPGTGPVPRTPNPALTDLDVILNPGLYVAPHITYFPTPPPTYGKPFIASDISFVAPHTLKLRCRLETSEYYPHPTNPLLRAEIWELGVFDIDSKMIAYFTFPKQTKENLILENYVSITF